MKMNQETLNKINRNFKDKTSLSSSISIQDSLKGISIFNKNWEICTLDELSKMIEDLTALRDSIEEVTGIKF